jgi:WbqC-like protein family
MADVYIDLDDAQFSKGSFTNRIRLKWGNERHWMSVPLKNGGTFTTIANFEAAETHWRREPSRHVGAIAQARPVPGPRECYS